MILEDYANAKVEIVDSLSATGGQGLLVLECCKMAENNLDFEEICQRSKILATTSGILFTVDDLKISSKEVAELEKPLPLPVSYLILNL